MYGITWLSNFLEDARNPKDFYASFRVLFLFAIIFGLIPINLPIFHQYPEQTNFFCSRDFGYIIIVLRIFLYSFGYLHSLYFNQSVLEYFFHTFITHFTDAFQKINGMFGILLVLLMCLLKKRHFINLFQCYEGIEELYSSVGVSFKYAVSSRWINYCVLIGFCIPLSIFIICHFGILIRNGIRPSITANISFYSPNIVICGVVVLHAAIHYKITEYLRALNKVLKNLSHQWENRSIKTITSKQRSLQCLDSFSMYTIVTKNPSEIIQESMEIHHLICEAASTANKYFTYQLLTIISIAFLIIVFDAYYVLETLLGKSKRESKFKTVEFVTFFSCQMILYLIAIISIVEGSNRAIKKSEKTSSIVHALLNKAKNPEVKEKLQQFSLQLTHMKINFTAAGLFNIDRTLYFTISGALTTYLIILLQFTSSTPNTNTICYRANETAETSNNL